MILLDSDALNFQAGMAKQVSGALKLFQGQGRVGELTPDDSKGLACTDQPLLRSVCVFYGNNALPGSTGSFCCPVSMWECLGRVMRTVLSEL